MRLSTENLLYKIEQHLRGNRMVPFVDEEGVVRHKIISDGEVKANERGIQSIMGFVSSQLNAAIAQGNFDDTRYYYHIWEMRREFALILVENMEMWGIEERNLSYIQELVILNLKAFLTRPLDNKERESYTGTVVARETKSGQGVGSQFKD